MAAEQISQTVRRLSPSLNDYRGLATSWPRDVLAGITVGIVAVPLALAFAIGAGAPAEMGLITAVIAGFVAAGIGVLITAVLALRALSRNSDVQRLPLPGQAQPGDDRIALIRFDGALMPNRHRMLRCWSDQSGSS